MARIPRLKSIDSTIALLRDPYRFIARQCDRLQTDVFQTRLLGQKAICMTGRDAAELFCDEGRFIRKGAAPRAIQKTLLGTGGVQALDEEAHRHRKAMFLSIITPGEVERLRGTFVRVWGAELGRWEPQREVVFYEAITRVLFVAACEWAGVPLAGEAVEHRKRQVMALFDAAGSRGPRHLWSRYARMRCNAWMAGLIRRIRSGDLLLPEECAASIVARHVDIDGRLLSEKVAAVELLNVIRPIVAVGVYLTWIGVTLETFPEWRRRLEQGDDRLRSAFVEEVRRFYPFFPAVTARTRCDFEWRGLEFPAGVRTMLDLHGTNRDPRLWDRPDEFWPERFLGRPDDPYSPIPQGAGVHAIHHRCPGEPITIALMEATIRVLSEEMEYAVPSQDLTIQYGRLPALPRGRLVLSGVRRREAAAAAGAGSGRE